MLKQLIRRPQASPWTPLLQSRRSRRYTCSHVQLPICVSAPTFNSLLIVNTCQASELCIRYVLCWQRFARQYHTKKSFLFIYALKEREFSVSFRAYLRYLPVVFCTQAVLGLKWRSFWCPCRWSQRCGLVLTLLTSRLSLSWQKISNIDSCSFLYW